MNYTEEERKAHRKFSVKIYQQRPDIREKQRQYSRAYNDKHRDKKRERDREYYERNRSQRISSISYYNKRSCRDPVLNDVVSYNTLIARRRYHPDLYKDKPSPKECLVRVPKIKGIEKYEAELKARETD